MGRSARGGRCTSNENSGLKSPKTGIDVDFYIPDASLAVQVAYSIAGKARKRGIDNLVKLGKMAEAPQRLVIVTREESELVETDAGDIEVVPAWRFLLDLARQPDV